MQIIYIHGFNSDASSIKGLWLQQYCAQYHPHIQVHRPDLNCPPSQVMALLAGLIQQDAQTAVIGSSLGGFFASACSALYGVPCVLVNPSVRPFDTMHKYLSGGRTSFSTKGGWVITADQFSALKDLFYDPPPQPQSILVLLKTADEVLDYRIAEQFYGRDEAMCHIITEQGGDHFMQDFADKLPLMLQFILQRW